MNVITMIIHTLNSNIINPPKIEENTSVIIKNI